MQNKNLKLKLGLCGLALTSFLALNARTTVHADTVPDSNSNNNAITWDSDSDDSQVVKEEPQQQIPAQSEHVQAPAVQQKQSAVQSVQSQQKIVQSAPKQATVQSNVQNRQSQSNVAVANVSSTQAMSNRAEKSIVRQSNVETSTVNRLNADNRANNVKVANVDATVTNNSNHVDIDVGDPFDHAYFNGNVTVHWVDKNGRNIKGISSDKDYNISVDEYGYTNNARATGQEATYSGADIVNGKYNVPAGYQLLYPQGTYDFKNHPTTLQSSLPDQMTPDDMTDSYGGNFGTYVGTTIPKAEYDKANQAWQRFIVDQEKRSDAFRKWADGTYNREDDTSYHLEISTGGKPDELYGYLQAGFTDANVPITLNGVKFNWNASNSNINDLRTIIKFMTDYCYTLTDGTTFHMVPNYKVGGPDFRFTDNSGNARQGATATTVNVTLVKSVPVNDASQTRKTATRVISVNLPNLPNDSDIKKRYESILNSNNQIVQTLTFTRSMTKDDLTGTVLSQSAWQGPSSFPSVTLPDIPGYTMTMN